MKKLIIILAILLFPALALAATDVTLEWDANSEEDLVGYRVYRGTESGVYTQVGEVTGTEFVDQALPDGVYYWVITAFDIEDLESGYSNEASIGLDSIAPNAPTGLRITITVIVE